MLASELRIALRRSLAGTCAVGLTLSVLPPMALASELAPLSSGDAGEATTLAQEPRGSRRRAVRDELRRQSRPSGQDRANRRAAYRDWARQQRGSGAGALTRPAPGFDRGNRRPEGGWIQRVPPGSLRPRPGLGGGTYDRPNWTRPGVGRPSWNRPGWNRPSWVFSRPVQINVINRRPRWWGSGWSRARPWRYGWYNSGYNRWRWWNDSSAAWGITSLAGAAILGAAINNALQADKPTIAVSDSPYELVYGSVTPVGSDEVSFNFLLGEESYAANANCQSGTLNGRTPVNPEEAQLMNAACQVAFSSFEPN